MVKLIATVYTNNLPQKNQIPKKPIKIKAFLFKIQEEKCIKTQTLIYELIHYFFIVKL